jgi:hypothetical protein
MYNLAIQSRQDRCVWGQFHFRETQDNWDPFGSPISEITQRNHQSLAMSAKMQSLTPLFQVEVYVLFCHSLTEPAISLVHDCPATFLWSIIQCNLVALHVHFSCSELNGPSSGSEWKISSGEWWRLNKDTFVKPLDWPFSSILVHSILQIRQMKWSWEQCGILVLTNSRKAFDNDLNCTA